MNFQKFSLKGSPFIGVFASVTDKTGLFPHYIEKKEAKKIEDTLGVEVVKAGIAETNLMGALVKGNSRGFVVPEIIEGTELRELEEQGLKVKTLNGVNALGNLIALNDFGGIASPLLGKAIVKELNKFFSLEFISSPIAKTEIVGSCVIATNKGFLANPNTSKEEFDLLKKTFKVEGQLGTANYGDPFIANDLLANSTGVLVGEHTSGHELIRIDEGLRGSE